MDNVHLNNFSNNSITVLLINKFLLGVSVENLIWKFLVTYKYPNS